MTKREQTIAMGVGAVVGIFILDWLVITPSFNRRAAAETNFKKAETELHDARRLIRDRPNLQKKMDQYVLQGLLNTEAEARFQLIEKLNLWASESGIDLDTISPGGAATTVVKPGGRGNEKEKAFLRVTCRALGKGRMDQVAAFLYRIQNASIPVRFTSLTLDVEKEGVEPLIQKVNLEVSTIFLAPETPPPGARGASPTTRGGGPATRGAASTTRGAGSTTRGANVAALQQTQSQGRSSATAPSTQPEARQ